MIMIGKELSPKKMIEKEGNIMMTALQIQDVADVTGTEAGTEAGIGAETETEKEAEIGVERGIEVVNGIDIETRQVGAGVLGAETETGAISVAGGQETEVTA